MYEPNAAIDAGYLDETTDTANLLARCTEIATGLKALPTASYAQMKRDVRQDSLAKIKASLK